MDEVLQEDETWRAMIKEVDELRRQVGKLQRDVIAPKKKAKENCEKEVAQMKDMKNQIKDIEKRLPQVAAKCDSLLNRIGNIVDPEVPISNNEDEDNLVVALYPEPLEAEGSPKPHLPCSLGTDQIHSSRLPNP